MARKNRDGFESPFPPGGPGEPEVVIPGPVQERMEKFARGDLKNERGGILVGSFTEKDGVFSLRISGFIEAKHTDSSSASLKFTHATWNDIHAVKDELFPEEKIVGWFHTHPGMGIFLSNYDLFIQRNFFKEPWQVAFVMDPVSGERGFFYWHEGRIMPQEKGSSPSREKTGVVRRASNPKAGSLKKRGKRHLSIKTAMVFLAGFLAGYFFRALTLEGIREIPGGLFGNDGPAGSGLVNVFLAVVLLVALFAFLARNVCLRRRRAAAGPPAA